jgi:hypothetical protein
MEVTGNIVLMRGEIDLVFSVCVCGTPPRRKVMKLVWRK